MDNPLTPQSNKTQADLSSNEQPGNDFSELSMLLDKEFREREERARQRDLAAREKLRLQEDFGQMQATYRWFSWKRLLLNLPGTVLALLLAGIIVHFAKDFIFVSLALVPALLVLWGVYEILAVLLNRTTIEISSGTLRVRHGPLLYSNNYYLSCADLKSVHTERTSKAGVLIFLPVISSVIAQLPEVSFYQLQATLKNGQEFDLVFGSNEPIIRCLEAAIEKHANLGDAGQLART